MYLWSARNLNAIKWTRIQVLVTSYGRSLFTVTTVCSRIIWWSCPRPWPWAHELYRGGQSFPWTHYVPSLPSCINIFASFSLIISDPVYRPTPIVFQNHTLIAPKNFFGPSLGCKNHPSPGHLDLDLVPVRSSVFVNLLSYFTTALDYFISSYAMPLFIL